MADLSIEAMSWAAAHFSGADLGDARRTKRLVEVMARMGTVAAAKAAYRLFATGAVTHASVMDPHRRLCLAEAAPHPVLLMVHDDTFLDVSGHPSLSGTGRIGHGHGTGFIAHSGLAVLPSGAVLGLVHQAICRPSGRGRPRTPRRAERVPGLVGHRDLWWIGSARSDVDQRWGSGIGRLRSPADGPCRRLGRWGTCRS